MEEKRQASGLSSINVNYPAKLLNMYGDFVSKNAGAVGQIEGALRSLTYIIPGRFRESDVASESLNSGVQLLALYHDSLLSRVLESSQRRQPQTPHTRYTRHYCRKSPTYKRTALTLQVIQYTELLLEMMAKRRGEKTRWRVVVLLESVKALCRLLLMRLTSSRPLPNPPLPEREMPDQSSTQNQDGLSSPPPEESGFTDAGSEQWTMPRTSLTLPPLPSGDDISNYLLSKVLTADDIKPPKALLHRTSGLGEAAEVMYILRPVIYAAAMAYWCQRRDSRGRGDWRPWLIGFSVEFGARQLAKRDLQSRRPGGQKALTQLEKEELSKRNWSMAWWAMRGAFYENVTSGIIRGVSGKLKGKPLLDMVGNIIDDYDFLWDQYYFPTATL
ncbi:peroxisomal membrane protein pex16 [Polychaeton citri CBS 116435]|uniref:Peroxisomal membrane protein PEX16 n=1 Tax=Polychaeton citri CBS 116435 TaxID=1314669 RepID=A0A9P4Q1U1_9PEZI|nr:peroxisomal membrane protein pex16 [Polychaeton citri CBS 116435]